MQSPPIVRIIDENLNRLAEGLRVLEDISRMVLNDSQLTLQLKSLRHDLIRGDLSFNLYLLESRDAAGDVGASLDVSGEAKEKDLCLLAISNSRRVQESLRVLEEVSKLPEVAARVDSSRFRQARFQMYVLEQALVSSLVGKDK